MLTKLNIICNYLQHLQELEHFHIAQKVTHENHNFSRNLFSCFGKFNIHITSLFRYKAACILSIDSIG